MTAEDSIQPSVRASCCLILYNVITGPSRLYPYLRQKLALLNSLLLHYGKSRLSLTYENLSYQLLNIVNYKYFLIKIVTLM